METGTNRGSIQRSIQKMRLKILILFLLIINLVNVNALLTVPFKPCSEAYYKQIWETILKEPYSTIKPTIYHEGPDINGNCSNFDLNIVKAGSGYKEVSFLLLTISNTNEKKVLAGNFQISDPENKWSLPTDFVQRYFTYFLPGFDIKDRSTVLITKEDAKIEHERYFKGLTNLNQWIVPSGLAGDFTYEESTTQNQIEKTEKIEIDKRQKYSIYKYSESNLVSDTFTTTSSTSSTSTVICSKGQARNCPLPGICSIGSQTCVNNYWSDCSIGPRKEVCFDKLDNNCNGIIDENCICKEGLARSCGPGIGICNKGTQICANGTWSKCQNAIQPINESCSNLLDDDCDGMMDIADPDCKQTQQINLCNNNKTDFDETGIDCGGSSCSSCPSCTDGKLNQGETKVNVIIDASKKSDCGGSNCPACPTCNDNIQNQNELGVDCGGPCEKSCDSPKDSDGDGVVDSKEIEIGTDPNSRDTDNDSLDDLQDTMPLCPNKQCDSDFKEDSETCPQDCSSIPVFPIIVIFFIFIPALGLLLYFLIKKQKKAKKEQGQQVFKIHPSFLRSQERKTRQDKVTEELKKIK